MDENNYFGSPSDEPETPSPNTVSDEPPELPDMSDEPEKKSNKRHGLLLASVILGILIVIGGTAYYEYRQLKASKKPVAATTQTPASTNTSTQPKVAGLQLDPNKNYGNKYANGLLPVGDGKYTTSEAKQGYVYACTQYAHNLQISQGGAGTRGPWFTNNNTEYDINKKIHVSGAVTWQASFSNTISGSTRTITTNDLPSHPTGVFPIASTDAAYAYDRNPNSISAQQLTYSLPLTPTYNTGQPSCMGGQAGIMLTGIALFNGFDAGGRDAGAWEVQDSCSGHPEKEGEYHYHTLSSCIQDSSISTVIGFALDGFPITGPKVDPSNILTTSDLDECHGIVSQINLDGKKTTTYHYVMTQDFPYSVSCFRGKRFSRPVSRKPQTLLKCRAIHSIFRVGLCW